MTTHTPPHTKSPWVLGLTIPALLGACLMAPSVRAQDVAVETERWSVAVSLAAGESRFNARGLTGYFEENGFDDTYDSFLGDIEYPIVEDETSLSWTLQATRSVRGHLSAGIIVHRAGDAEASGHSDTDGRATLRQSMWAVAPVVVWRPWGDAGEPNARPWWANVAVGAGPAYVRGRIDAYEGRDSALDRRLTPAELGFSRVGAMASLSYDEKVGPIRIGVQGRYLYVGKQGIGPFEGQGLRIDASSPLLDQLTAGLIVSLDF